MMVKKGEVGIPRSAETRLKIGIGARNTRLSEVKPCPEGCGKSYNSGNMATHLRSTHYFVCKLTGCDATKHRGYGYCTIHYNLHAFCVKIGITLDRYFEVYEEQEGKCKICSRDGALQRVGSGPKVDVLVIDHCHNTNVFRGLLCHRCNLALGHFQDNIESLEKALQYLKDNA